MEVEAPPLFPFPPPPPPPKDCNPSYPDPRTCIKSPPPDLNCKDIPLRNFKVVGNDPHRFDGDNDGIGCEGGGGMEGRGRHAPDSSFSALAYPGGHGLSG